MSLFVVIVMICNGYTAGNMNWYKSDTLLIGSDLDAKEISSDIHFIESDLDANETSLGLQKVSFTSKEIAGWESS